MTGRLFVPVRSWLIIDGVANFGKKSFPVQDSNPHFLQLSLGRKFNDFDELVSAFGGIFGPTWRQKVFGLPLRSGRFALATRRRRPATVRRGDFELLDVSPRPVRLS
jgi:hypothetical protein